jgi:hypothetical protein
MELDPVPSCDLSAIAMPLMELREELVEARRCRDEQHQRRSPMTSHSWGTPRGRNTNEYGPNS